LHYGGAFHQPAFMPQLLELLSNRMPFIAVNRRLFGKGNRL
jgi:hypothetical protein